MYGSPAEQIVGRAEPEPQHTYVPPKTRAVAATLGMCHPRPEQLQLHRAGMLQPEDADWESRVGRPLRDTASLVMGQFSFL